MNTHPPARSHFFRLATWFEGSLVLLAYIIAWFVGINPFASFSFDVQSIIYGLAGTIPLYMMFLVTFRSPNAALNNIREFLMNHMGPVLADSSLLELAYLAMLAGVTEETLFRGVLQPAIEMHWGWLAGLLISNFFFAAAHAITPLYALLAGLTGVYLGIALDITGTRNLVIPMAIHAIYDFLAFIAVASAFRREHGKAF